MSREAEPRGWWQTRWGLALAGFLVVAAFFLLSEHAAHAFGALPYVLLLACPLMHAFMHHGRHGGPDSRGTHPRADDRREAGQ